MKVLICGAGIAGLATAYWLHRHGWEPTVVERAPELRDGGYKVDIRGTAVDVVERMGLQDAIRDRATAMRTATQYDERGRAVAVLDAELFGGRHSGDLEIMRGDLTQLLYEQTRHRLEHVFGAHVVAAEQDDAQVRVAFASGEEREFDFVIGADGVHSSTRRLCFGDTVPHSLGHHIAIYTVPNHLGLDRQEAVHLAPGRTVNVYSTGGPSAKALFLFAGPESNVDPRTFLADSVAGMGWEVPRLIGYAADAPDFYLDTLAQVRLDSWSKGRIALVGDAAFCPSPASGQGTSLALVGAYALAGELAANPAGGFAAYEAQLRDFVAKNQALAAGNLRGMVVGSAFGVWAQTRMMRLLPHLPGHRAIIGRVADTIHEAATAVTLRDY
ncbi:FAD-dependent oxidoreductase [Hamadaea sp. NPDC051192]|uniref:FAD-dependent oxidoreductase n=1 Tax=Hamadaea sp. NPDC051192 TaxID=3154940 RepID=UPI0034195A40